MNSSEPSKKQKSTRFPFKLPNKEDMGNALRLAAEARELSEEERRYLFRELAKDLLDPNAEELCSLYDNEGNRLGYFEPLRHHFLERAKQFAQPLQNPEELLEGALPFEELVNRVLHSHQIDEN